MSNSTSHQSRFLHYGWVIVAVGVLVLFSCLGLARYAYTMLLPAMQTGLQLSYDRMGLIGTANFSGYLVAVVLSPWLLRRFRPRAVISAGLLLIALCMAGISQSRGFLTAALLYAFTGLGGGLANIPLMALVPCWFRSRVRGRAAGLIIGGNGLAIICAGYLIPLLNRQYAAAGLASGLAAAGSHYSADRPDCCPVVA
jgi:Sugar phosphate permease